MATVDIPDDLYRRVKAKSALEGKRVREVTIEPYRRWLGEGEGPGRAQSSQSWLDGWL